MSSKNVSAENIETSHKTSEPEKSRTIEINYCNRSFTSALLSTKSAVEDPHFWGEMVFKDHLLVIFKTLLI